MCPIGFDPMLNFLTQEDAASALQKAIHSEEQGVFNIPGADTLPLYDAVSKWGRVAIPTPSFLLYRSTVFVDYWEEVIFDMG